jgi:hypothetical protein
MNASSLDDARFVSRAALSGHEPFPVSRELIDKKKVTCGATKRMKKMNLRAVQ